MGHREGAPTQAGLRHGSGAVQKGSLEAVVLELHLEEGMEIVKAITGRRTFHMEGERHVKAWRSDRERTRPQHLSPHLPHCNCNHPSLPLQSPSVC